MFSQISIKEGKKIFFLIACPGFYETNWHFRVVKYIFTCYDSFEIERLFFTLNELTLNVKKAWEIRQCPYK